MANTIDHVVIVVRDLDQAVANYAAAGFTVTPGGEHADLATHNALIPFADGSYLELIAFREPERPSAHQWWPRLAQGEGMVHYALRSDDLPADVARLRAAGIAISDPRDGGRTRPDGQALRWRTAAFEGGFALPFLIEDVTPRELRVPGGAAAEHPLKVYGIAGLRVAMEDLALSRALEMLIRMPLAQDPAHATRLQDQTAVRFVQNPGWIEFVRADDPAAGASATLARFGSGPYELVLRRAARATGDGTSLAGELHGAHIRVLE